MIRWFTVFICAVILSGCATVNRGATDYFRIDTVPPGATATTSIETSASKSARTKNRDLEPVYKSCEPTPCSIALPRRSEFIVTLEQPGFEKAEMFITNSTSSRAFSENMAATTASAAGVTAVAAGTVAVGSAIATGVTTLTFGTVGGLASGLTFGLIPVQTGFTAASSAVPAASGVSSAFSAVIPPALAVTGGMLLTDAATGANVNLFPNPVVLELAPKGTPIKFDPNVEPFRNLINLKDQRDYYCGDKPKPKISKADAQEKCRMFKTAYKEAVDSRKAAEKDAKAAIKAAQKEEP